MVAMAVLDSVVSLVWIGGLALVLLGKALLSWVRFRQATRSAAHARRLAEATRPLADPSRGRDRPHEAAQIGQVLAFGTRKPAEPPSASRGA
jgi:hypothetical protein